MKLILSSLAAVLLCVACASHSAKTETAPAAKATETKAEATSASAAKTSEAKGAESASVTCTKGKDVRTLKAETLSPKGCKATYTVKGTDKVLATAAHDSGYCNRKVEKVKANLTAVGFKCE